MKLAEALILRKDIQQRLSMLDSRLSAAARVQEGDQPVENPHQLMAELDTLTDQLATLIADINHTNSATRDGEDTLTDLLAQRDTLQYKIRVLRGFAGEAGQLVSRQLRSEIRIMSTVDVAALRRQVDGLCKELRELDMRLQGLNWQVELITRT